MLASILNNNNNIYGDFFDKFRIKHNKTSVILGYDDQLTI